MRDLFDDFMDELRRRQAEASGQPPPPRRPRPDDDDAENDADDDGPDGLDGSDDEDALSDDDVTSTDADDDDEPGTDEPRDDESGGDDGTDRPGRVPRDEPEIITGRVRRTSSSRRRRRRAPVGGPTDGASLSIGDVFRRLGCAGLLVAAAIVFVLITFGIDLWTDAIWFRTVGFDSVFWTRIGAEVALFVAILLVALVVFLGNLILAVRLVPPTDPDHRGPIRTIVDRLNEAARAAEGSRPFDPFGGGQQRGPVRDRPAAASIEELPDLGPLGTWVIAGLAILIGLGVAGAAAGSWETVLLWQNKVDFGTTDPIFGRDVSFFMFELPFLRFGQSIFNGLVVGGLLAAGARYGLAALAGGPVFTTRVRVHLGILAGLTLLSIAAGYQLSKLELSYSHNSGIFTGVSYTDQAARFLALDAQTLIAGLVGAFLVAGAFTRLVWPLGGAVAVWLIASVVLGLYPEVIQRFVVTPNTFAQEAPYIQNNITMTRQAYGLNAWPDEQPYGGEKVLTAAQIADDGPTFDNARLWDYRPLGQTLGQLQIVRQYYDFVDVDTDRYQIGSKTRQVMVSARELALEKNPQATNWVNQRVVFTHGIGVAMVPVNEVASQGLPRLLVRDLPPTSDASAPVITQPRIYFGERPSDYIVVGARQDEFDYPQGTTAGEDQAIQTRWSGTSGVRLDTVLPRLLFAARFRDLNLLISDQVTQSSQLLFHRSLADRLPRIAPFLSYDKDPYVVVGDDGRLVYIQDAYTTSDRYPGADAFSPTALPTQAGGPSSGLGVAPLNYIRNSVKIVMNAYDGSMTFYITDPTDPIIRAWSGVFPQLFRPFGEMPEDLLAHLRVPEEMFNVQTRVYARYHVRQPEAFFNNSDVWRVPEDQSSAQSLANEAYYVYMRMPGEATPEFLLLQPMLPSGRPNMIAWVAARNDPAHYGETRVFRFPSNTNVFGPAQIEAQIDADPIISAQISLWNQSGSTVVRGNLIVVPVQDSIVYLQPIYLRSTSALFPRFERIVVASPRYIVWAETLDEALQLLLTREASGGPPITPTPTPTPDPGGSPSPGTSPTPTAPPTPTPGPGETPPAGDVAALIAYANRHFEIAQEALRNGDFATYGAEMDLVEAALARLRDLVPPSGEPAASSPPGGAPVP